MQRRNSHWDAAAAVLRSIAAGGIASVGAGVLIGGLGGRAVMRLSALADPGAEGAVTESGNRVGEITAGGTGELIIFGGIFAGVFAGIAWVMVRPWLSRLGKYRPAAAAVISAAAGSIFVLSADIDFALLDPAWLNVTMFLVLLALMGAGISLCDSWLHERLPQAHGWNAAIYGVLAVGAAPLMVPMMGNYFSEEFCDCSDPPRLTGLFLASLGALTATSWGLQIRSGDATLIPPIWLRTAGEIAVGGLIIAGAIFTLQEIRDLV